MPNSFPFLLLCHLPHHNPAYHLPPKILQLHLDRRSTHRYVCRNRPPKPTATFPVAHNPGSLLPEDMTRSVIKAGISSRPSRIMYFLDLGDVDKAVESDLKFCTLLDLVTIYV